MGDQTAVWVHKALEELYSLCYSVTVMCNMCMLWLFAVYSETKGAETKPNSPHC